MTWFIYTYNGLKEMPGKAKDFFSYAGNSDNVCTCGAVKACEPNPPTGHSDWCDINNPPPETEELPF